MLNPSFGTEQQKHMFNAWVPLAKRTVGGFVKTGQLHISLEKSAMALSAGDACTSNVRFATVHTSCGWCVCACAC